MLEFKVCYIGPDGSSNECILEANCCNDAIEYAESIKGGRVGVSSAGALMTFVDRP